MSNRTEPHSRPRNYKAINFDLKTAPLRAKFGEAGRAEAYRKIGRYLSEQGFEHRQGSGYRSTLPFSDSEMVDLHSDMYNDLEWLGECVSKLDVTNIGSEYDMDSIVRRRGRHTERE